MRGGHTAEGAEHVCTCGLDTAVVCTVGGKSLYNGCWTLCVNLTLANPSARVRCHSSPQGWQSH